MTQMAYHFGALLVLHSFQIYLSRDRMAYKYDLEEYEGQKLLYMRRVDFEVIHEATKHLLSQVNRWNINAVTESNPQPYLKEAQYLDHMVSFGDEFLETEEDIVRDRISEGRFRCIKAGLMLYRDHLISKLENELDSRPSAFTAAARSRTERLEYLIEELKYDPSLIYIELKDSQSIDAVV